MELGGLFEFSSIMIWLPVLLEILNLSIDNSRQTVQHNYELNFADQNYIANDRTEANFTSLNNQK